MDGFLFGACCLLPPNSDVDKLNYTLNEGLNEDVLTNIHELDHVPDIPILLNPDGTPIESSIPDTSVKTSAQNDINLENVNYTKVATFSPNKNSTYNKDKTQNAEKIQLPLQEDLSAVQQQYPILIGEQQILDDLRLPSLLSHSDSNNDLQVIRLFTLHSYTFKLINQLTNISSLNLTITNSISVSLRLFLSGAL